MICLNYYLKFVLILTYYLKTTGISKIKGKKFRLLALNYTRFNEDLKILEKTAEFKSCKLPFHRQSRFLNHFYSEEKRSKIGFKQINKEKQKIFRNFLESFLFKYYRFLKINCVIGAAIHYRQDIDLGEVSSRIGVPYVVLHKKNLFCY